MEYLFILGFYILVDIFWVGGGRLNIWLIFFFFFVIRCNTKLKGSIFFDLGSVNFPLKKFFDFQNLKF
jgi:hypothetical protein